MCLPAQAVGMIKLSPPVRWQFGGCPNNVVTFLLVLQFDRADPAGLTRLRRTQESDYGTVGCPDAGTE
jgi:hypothetical protein